MNDTIVSFLVVTLLVLVLVQSFFAVYKVHELTSPTAKVATGSVYLCINNPPSFLPYMCNTTITQNVFYSCQLFAVEPDNDSVTYQADTLNGSLSFNVSVNGLVSTTPSQGDVGNNTVRFGVRDAKNCSNSQAYLYVNFTVIDVNDPPRYLPNYGLALPMGPYQWSLSSSLRGIFLNTFFDDPDGDPLTYSDYSLSDGFSVAILPSSEVVFGALQCGTGYVFFRATDTHNASADSGLVSLEVPCEEQKTPDSGNDDFSGESCVSEWHCGEWSKCFSNGTQHRKCTDIYACNTDYIKWFWQNCTYIEQCYNGVQDFFWEGSELNEEGIDCGGPCEVCQTCTDGILNNGEEAIDCGGPNCDPCVACDDGVQNFGETGVDCGGPCNPCPSCSDGIRNQNETGVDCGGQCPPCTRIENPLPISKSIFVTVLASLLGILAVLLILYRLFRKQLHVLLAHLWWYINRNRRKQVLLKPEQKEELLHRITEIEKKDLLMQKKKFAEFQNETARVLHTLFEMLLANRNLKMGVAYEETLRAIDKLKTTKQVKSMLKRHFSLLLYMERKEIILSEELKTLFEFLRQEVFSLSRITRADVARPIQEMELSKEPEETRFLQIIYNGLLALQFNELVIAKKKYSAAYEVYMKLLPSAQERLYIFVRLYFEQITYASSFYNESRM